MGGLKSIIRHSTHACIEQQVESQTSASHISSLTLFIGEFPYTHVGGTENPVVNSHDSRPPDRHVSPPQAQVAFPLPSLILYLYLVCLIRTSQDAQNTPKSPRGTRVLPYCKQKQKTLPIPTTQHRSRPIPRTGIGMKNPILVHSKKGWGLKGNFPVIGKNPNTFPLEQQLSMLDCNISELPAPTI